MDNKTCIIQKMVSGAFADCQIIWNTGTFPRSSEARY